MRLDLRKEVLWVHQLWLIEEAEKTKPDPDRVSSLKKVIEALISQEPTEGQRQILQRLAVGMH